MHGLKLKSLASELFLLQERTPNGNWPTDDVLVQETVKALDSTKDQSDFVYTITVEGHGDYPTEKILTDPAIKVSGAATEESNNQWEYYVNMIHEVDDFIGDLISAVDRRGEDTIVVMFGDHLPTMGLSDSDMKSGIIVGKCKLCRNPDVGNPAGTCIPCSR